MAKNTDLIFEKIIDTALECIFWKDRDRKYVGVNKAFLNYFGLEKEDDLIGKNDEEMGWLTDTETFVSDEMKVLEGETVYMRHAILIIKGEKRDIMISKAPIYDDDRIVGLAGSLVDVTEEKRKEREIEELRKKGSLSKKINGLLYFSDTHGNFPKEEPDYPVWFAVPENHSDAPCPDYVRKIIISEEQMNMWQ